MARDKQIQVRRDVSSDWTSINPILASGEPGLETNTGKLKFGDGVTAWNDLPYLTQGLKGDKGDRGYTGSTGLKGDPGNDGAPGATGATGLPGSKGDTGAKGDKGDTGAAGINGSNGAKGEKGDKGDKGDTGNTGSPGLTGSQGIQGEKGDTGDTGAPGADGVIQSIVGGSGITVDNTDPANPEVSTSGAVTSVNGDTGDVVLNQDDVLDGTTNKQYSATEKTKLAGIEASADVTDATNVSAAGAFMKSVDDTDDITVGSTNKFATAAEKTKLGFIAVTQAVDLDTMESDIANKQPLDATLTAVAALSTTGFVGIGSSGSAASSRTIAAGSSKISVTNGNGASGNPTIDLGTVVKGDVGLGNVDNTSDATKQAATLLAAYPVGSIYINTSNTNPGTFIGGTWAAFGAGRVPVGFDSGQTEFDTDEETGGAKTHTLITSEMPAHSHHSGYAGVNATASYGVATASAVGNTNSQSGTSAANHDVSSTTGGGGAHNNLQPYIVVRMWKRTA